MRISQLMLSKGLGGAERYFVDLCLALCDLGHEVQAICHERFVALAELETEPRLTLKTVNAKGMWDFLSVKRISDAVKRYQPALIHAHLARGAWAGAHAAKGLGIPLIVKTHNYVNLKYYKNVDFFIPTTRSQERYLHANGVDAEHIELIPNFSSLTPVAQSVTGRNDMTTFVSYGRMVEKKGFALLISAFEALIAEGYAARLRIGGDGPLRSTLVREVKQRGLSQHVVLPGWIDNVSGFLTDGDVFVLPSLDEPFGIALLEAMAMGLCIVSTRTEGPLEILDDSCAILVKIGEVDALKNGMVIAARESDLRSNKARIALDRYRHGYYRDAVVPRILALYQRACAGENLPRSE